MSLRGAEHRGAGADFRILLDAGIRDRIMSGYTQSRLMLMAQFAIAIDNIDALTKIMRHVKFVDVPIRGETLLMTAAEYGNIGAARLLVDEHHADKDATNLSGNTAYDIAVMKGASDLAQFLGAPARPEQVVRVNKKSMSMK